LSASDTPWKSVGARTFCKVLLSKDRLVSVVDQACSEQTIQAEVAALQTIVILDGEAFLLVL